MNTRPTTEGGSYATEAQMASCAVYDDLLWKFRAVFWEADPISWQFLYVSEYAELLFGYPRRRWLEEKDFWVKILHPDDREFAVRYCRQATEQGQDHCFDYRLIAADGRVVWVRDVVRVECEGFSRQAKRLYGILLDITEQKERELQHQRDKEKLQHLLGQIPVVLWTVDGELRFTSSLGRGLSRLHLQAGQVAGMTLYEYFATADDNFLPIAMHRRALAGESVSYDFAWQGRVFHTVLAPQREGQRVVGVIGVATDVTERRAETELLRKKLCAEKRLESLVKRSERLLRGLASVSDSAQRRQRAVEGLVSTFGCRSAAVLQPDTTGEWHVLAAAGQPTNWRSYSSSLRPTRRELFFTVPVHSGASRERIFFLPIGRSKKSATYLALIHPDWETMPRCTLRLVRILADFLATTFPSVASQQCSTPEPLAQEGREEDITGQQRCQ
ncbi:hypothetical protein HRbin36_00771 [bacterium HR36]|nr:hypothetical protein HRbin36_00771 [bacterium HR36]